MRAVKAQPSQIRHARSWIAAVMGFGLVAVAGNAEERSFEAVLTTAGAVTGEAVAGWKREGFAAVAVVLDDGLDARVLRNAADAVAARSLDLYYWIEVGRNPALAREHPEWMASLGTHNDWRRRFPEFRPPVKGQVAKAWPWVPIRYRDAFDAHLARIDRLLARVPEGYRGVLINDLQGGPGSCGCGNLQCRWATDYGVPSTGAKLDVADSAARFVAEVGKRTKGKEIIPVWTPECEWADLPDDKLPPEVRSTGYCGKVPCFEFCRKMFGKQWTALNADRSGPTGLLLLHKEFDRGRAPDDSPAEWLTRSVKYVEEQAEKPVPRNQLWLVVQGYDVPPEEEATVRGAAAKIGAGTVLVARTRIDQAYQPRLVTVKAGADAAAANSHDRSPHPKRHE
ncbi:MAG: hypothetical protein KY476_22620 [Planctomycetes bacterium]|nr:hypothetical protein [Planctomycetota bacterium]